MTPLKYQKESKDARYEELRWRNQNQNNSVQTAARDWEEKQKENQEL